MPPWRPAEPPAMVWSCAAPAIAGRCCCGAAEWIDSTGLPLGLFCDGRYATRQVLLDAGESLVLYSDGITEAQDAAGNPFEEDGLKRSFAGHSEKDAASLAEGVVRDVARFCGARPQQD